MNDFTKEELKELIYGLYCRTKLDGHLVNKFLYEKLQSIIDNYCEHDNCGGEVEIFVDTCSKCKAFMLREKYYE